MHDDLKVFISIIHTCLKFNHVCLFVSTRVYDRAHFGEAVPKSSVFSPTEAKPAASEALSEDGTLSLTVQQGSCLAGRGSEGRI